MNKNQKMVMNFSSNFLYGVDSLIELLLVVTALSISYYSYKVSKLVKDRKYLVFSIVFFLLGISYIFQIIANLIVYYQIRQTGDIIFVITSNIPYTALIKAISHFLYELLSLSGFIILFFIITGTKEKEKIFLLLYLAVVVALFSLYFPAIYHITLFLILFFLSGFFYKNYLKVRSVNSFLVFLSFAILFISNLFLTFSGFLSGLFYLSGGFLTLIAYGLLLINQVNIKNEQKKNKAGSSKRYFGSSKSK